MFKKVAHYLIDKKNRYTPKVKEKPLVKEVPVTEPKPLKRVNLRLNFKISKPRVKKWSKVFGIFILLFVIFFAIMNAPVIYLRVKYWFSPKSDEAKTANNQENSNNDTLPENPENTIKGSSLIIPKISVNAPIIWTQSTSEDAIMADLDKGIVHYANTSYPGQKGNVGLTGHSSNYVWSKGAYNYVFSLLDQIAVGDTITILYEGKKFVYKVTGSKVVLPEDTSVLNPTPESTLTLITCYPIGTNLKRLIVTASQTYPEASKNKEQNKSILPGANSLIGN